MPDLVTAWRSAQAQRGQPPLSAQAAAAEEVEIGDLADSYGTGVVLEAINHARLTARILALSYVRGGCERRAALHTELRVGAHPRPSRPPARASPAAEADTSRAGGDLCGACNGNGFTGPSTACEVCGGWGVLEPQRRRQA